MTTKNPRISFIFNILDMNSTLTYNLCMHNLYAIVAKFLEICKEFSETLENEKGNQPRPSGHKSGFYCIFLPFCLIFASSLNRSASSSLSRAYSNRLAFSMTAFSCCITCLRIILTLSLWLSKILSKVITPAGLISPCIWT